VAREAGRDCVQFNASDVRSKKGLTQQTGDIFGSQTLEFDATQRTKRVVVMDEVDGMGAGDRSGLSELVQIIKSSRVPIICICNDRQALKLKTLVTHCLDLRYRRPVKSQVATRVLQIAAKEGLTVDPNAAEALVESCGNDIRQVLNGLQMWAQDNNGSMTYKALKDREKGINKDEILRVSLFDAARLILEGRKGLSGATPEAQRQSFFRRSDAFFVDYSFMGLLVQQNYLKVMQGSFHQAKRSANPNDQVNVLHRMHAAADCMSQYALADSKLRGAQNWSLLPFTAALTVQTGSLAGGETGGILPGFPEFTAWLGKNSSTSKKMRILHELQHHLNFHVSASGATELRMTYLPVFCQHLTSLLHAQELEQAIRFMDEYGLNRDDVLERLDELRLTTKKSSKSIADTLDSKSKTAFTKLYNAGVHKSQALVAEQGAVKAPKRKKTAAEAGDLDAIDYDDQQESEEEEEELDAEKIKALFKRKGRRKAASTKSKKAKKK